jgi:peroxiredoxin
MQRRHMIQLGAQLGGALALGGGASAALSMEERVKAPVVGDKAPRLMGNTLDNTKFDLRDMRGKTTLVAYWATWCPTCRVEMPEFRTRYESLRGNKFDLVTVSIDAKLDDVLVYDKLVSQTVPIKQQFPRMWRKQEGLSDQFGRVTSTPTAYLIDRDMKVVGVFKGRMMGDQWSQIEQEVLRKG